MPIDNTSQRFILRDLGLPGSSFINSDLEFQSHHEFVNDNIIEFGIKNLIKIIPCPDKFFYVDATLIAYYSINATHSTKEYSASIKNENKNSQWTLLQITGN